MKNILIFIVTTMFIGCEPKSTNTQATNDPDTGAVEQPASKMEKSDTLSTQIPDEIESIRKEFERINANRVSMTQTIVTYDCYGEEVGNITYFIQDGKVRMIEQKYNELSHRDAVKQYYLANRALFFAFFKYSDWSFDTESDQSSATKEKITEERYYVVGKDLIQCLIKKYETQSSADNNPSSIEVTNEKINCPPADEILDGFRKVMEHREGEPKIKCL